MLGEIDRLKSSEAVLSMQVCLNLIRSSLVRVLLLGSFSPPYNEQLYKHDPLISVQFLPVCRNLCDQQTIIYMYM